MPLAPSPGTLTVLIADDEAHVVEFVRVTLEDERVGWCDAPDGVTALPLAAELEPELIFLDVHLPDLSGLEVCRRLRRHPRLAGLEHRHADGRGPAGRHLPGPGGGATQYLTKPFSPVRLLSLVEGLLPGAAWLPE